MYVYIYRTLIELIPQTPTDKFITKIPFTERLGWNQGLIQGSSKCQLYESIG